MHLKWIMRRCLVVKEMRKINPTVILTIDTQAHRCIPMTVTTIDNNIKAITSVQKMGSHYNIRKQVITLANLFIQQYNIDTILMEQNKLFIDKIDRHPDPFVLSNITLGYGIKIVIQDNYYDSVKYIIELPQREWRETVLNKSVKYSIDLYKSHILLRDLTQDFLQIINETNCYKALCLSESVLYDNLMNKKYLINKE